MSEQPKEVPKKEEVPKEESPKKESCKKECPKFPWFHGFGPRCHGKKPFCHPHKHKERKCECGEVIPKRKEGEPKIKVCPKCGKDLPKKEHGFGMRCHKMKKFMKYMWMMKMHRGTQFGPKCFGLRPPFPKREMQVHHYIHLGPPHHHFGIPPMGMGRFGRFPMMAPGFCRTSMGPGFGRPPMGPGFGRPPMGPGFWRFGRQTTNGTKIRKIWKTTNGTRIRKIWKTTNGTSRIRKTSFRISNGTLWKRRTSRTF